MEINQTVSAVEMHRNASRCFEKAKENPLFIIRNNKIEFVLLSTEKYETLQKEAEVRSHDKT